MKYAPKVKRKSKRRNSINSQRTESIGESTLANQLRVLKISFEQEYKFHPKRKWRADFHITGTKILIEVEGGVWSGGRHTRGKGYIADMEKYNSAQELGYSVYRYSTEQVKSGKAIEEIRRLKG